MSIIKRLYCYTLKREEFPKPFILKFSTSKLACVVSTIPEVAESKIANI